jgi:hypothetical protein
MADFRIRKATAVASASVTVITEQATAGKVLLLEQIFRFPF